MHWGQKIAERHHLNVKKNVYTQHHLEDANLVEEELKIILNEGGEELRKLVTCMQIHNANILGSNLYFHKKRKELKALIEQEGLYTAWFVLSAANNYWLYLNHIIHDNRPDLVFTNEDEKAK